MSLRTGILESWGVIARVPRSKALTGSRWPGAPHQAFIVGPNCGWTYAEHALSDSKKFHTSAIFTHLEPGERLQFLERSFQFTTRPSAIQRVDDVNVL